jgi:putative Mg2+ transporter-C (MgtC) family protein
MLFITVEFEWVAQVILGFILSSIVGFERELSLKPAGFRTHILVGLGSTLLTIMSLNAFPEADSARVAASIIIGIGFLGAGTIVKTTERITGLTTAATLWMVASIGVTTGAGYYILAITATALAFIALKLTMFERGRN